MPAPCQIKYPEKPPIILLQAKQMCVYQQSGCVVVFSMSKLQLKEIGSEPGIKSTGCLWVVLPILFSCCACLCLHFGKLNNLVYSRMTCHVSAGLPYYDYIKWYVQLNKLSFKPSCVHIPNQDIFLGSHLGFSFFPNRKLCLSCISVSNAICCICCSMDMEGYGDCTHNPLGKDCKNEESGLLLVKQASYNRSAFSHVCGDNEERVDPKKYNSSCHSKTIWNSFFCG